MLSYRTVAIFVKEAVRKIAGEGGHYISFFTGEKRKDATFFPPGAMARSAEEIAEMAKSKEVAPYGSASAIRFISYYRNRAGKKLPQARKDELSRAIKLIGENARKK